MYPGAHAEIARRVREGEIVNELIAKLEREKTEFLHRVAETLTKEFERSGQDVRRETK
jgi:hypothetical protein